MDLVSPDFYRLAACRGVDPEVFFDLDHEPGPETKGQKQRSAETGYAQRKMQRRVDAKAYCESCPVRAECLAVFADATEGVFGGYDKDERRTLRRKRQPRRNDSVIESAEVARLFEEGKSISQVMTITELPYELVMQYKPKYRRPTAPVRKRPEPPSAWGGGIEAYVWDSTHWQTVQYLGDGTDDRTGQVLVQNRNRGITVRRWCKAEDVTVRPDVTRYTARRFDRREVNGTYKAAA